MKGSWAGEVLFHRVVSSRRRSTDTNDDFVKNQWNVFQVLMALGLVKVYFFMLISGKLKTKRSAQLNVIFFSQRRAARRSQGKQKMTNFSN